MKQPKFDKTMEHINIDMTEYKTRLTTKFKKRKFYKKADPKIINAVIPGTVRRIYVEEGKTVKKGDRLLVLEAMKMRNYLKAPFNGKIKKIHVEMSNVVYKEQILMEYE